MLSPEQINEIHRLHLVENGLSAESLVTNLPFLREVHARDQGPNGEELHRQPLRRSAERIGWHTLAKFESQPPSEKRKLLDFVLSNCCWKDGQLEAKYRQPFDLIASAAFAHRHLRSGHGPEGGFFDNWR
jgi:hypothetical protein